MANSVLRQSLWSGIWTLLSGLSIGFLVGLSTTPVVQTVIASVLALAVAVVTALVGLNDIRLKETPVTADQSEKRTAEVKFLVAPLACLLMGVAAGACLGVLVRSQHWLAPNPEAFAKRWEKSGLGESELTRRLLEQEYPTGTGDGSKSGVPPVLFATISAKEYDKWTKAEHDDLYRLMLSSHNPDIREFASRCVKNPDALKAVLGTLIKRQ